MSPQEESLQPQQSPASFQPLKMSVSRSRMPFPNQPGSFIKISAYLKRQTAQILRQGEKGQMENNLNYLKVGPLRLKKYKLPEYQTNMLSIIYLLLTCLPTSMKEIIIFQDFLEGSRKTPFMWEIKDQLSYLIKSCYDLEITQKEKEKFKIPEDEDAFPEKCIQENIEKLAYKLIQKNYYMLAQLYHDSRLTVQAAFRQKKSSIYTWIIKYLKKQLAIHLSQIGQLNARLAVPFIISQGRTELSSKNIQQKKYLKNFYNNKEFQYLAGCPKIILKKNVKILQVTPRTSMPHQFYLNKQKEVNNISYIYNIIQPIIELILAADFLIQNNQSNQKTAQATPLIIIIKFILGDYKQIKEHLQTLGEIIDILFEMIARKYNALIVFEYKKKSKPRELRIKNEDNILNFEDQCLRACTKKTEKSYEAFIYKRSVEIRQSILGNLEHNDQNQFVQDQQQSELEDSAQDIIQINQQDTQKLKKLIFEQIKQHCQRQNFQYKNNYLKKYIYQNFSKKMNKSFLPIFQECWREYYIGCQLMRMLSTPNPEDRRIKDDGPKKRRKILTRCKQVVKIKCNKCLIMPREESQQEEQERKQENKNVGKKINNDQKKEAIEVQIQDEIQQPKSFEKEEAQKQNQKFNEAQKEENEQEQQKPSPQKKNQ